MTDPIVAATGIEKGFGAVKALQGVDLRLSAGERLGIIGPNGSGKTTLFNLLSGVLRPDTGQILLAGQDTTGWPRTGSPSWAWHAPSKTGASSAT